MVPDGATREAVERNHEIGPDNEQTEAPALTVTRRLAGGRPGGVRTNAATCPLSRPRDRRESYRVTRTCRFAGASITLLLEASSTDATSAAASRGTAQSDRANPVGDKGGSRAGSLAGPMVTVA
jgi:hypothetical protein